MDARDNDQATHGSGKRDAEGQSSDDNQLQRGGRPGSVAPADGEAERMKKGTRTGAQTDPQGLGPKDEERRTAPARRAPAEG